MNRCYNCYTKIQKHLWVVDERVYCSPRCERGKNHRFSDKVVERLGVAGLVKEKRKRVD